MSDGIISSRGASTFFAVAFGLLSGYHLLMMFLKRNWLILWFVIGGILELSGYADTTAGDGSQSVQVIIAPIFLAASIYLSFGKLLRKLDHDILSFSRSCTQSTVFVIGDIASLGLQISGIVLGSMSRKTLGKALVISGFTVQLLFLSVFCFLVIKMHKTLRRRLRPVDRAFHSWNSYFIVIYISVCFLLVRYVYRVAEYGQGVGGYIFRHAIFEYVFDGAFMVLLMLCLCIVHPGMVYSRIESRSETDVKISSS